MITESKVTEIFVLQMISARNLMVRWQKMHFRPQLTLQNGKKANSGRIADIAEIRLENHSEKERIEVK